MTSRAPELESAKAPELLPYLQKALAAFDALVRENRGAAPSHAQLADRLGKSKSHGRKCVEKLVAERCLRRVDGVRYYGLRLTLRGARIANQLREAA